MMSEEQTMTKENGKSNKWFLGSLLIAVFVFLTLFCIQEYSKDLKLGKIEKRYNEYWKAYETVFSSSTADLNELEKYARGSYLRKVVAGAEESRNNKNISIGKIEHKDVKASLIDSNTATVRDCMNFGNWKLADFSGVLVKNQIVRSKNQLYSASIQFSDNDWFVMGFTELGEC
jgi:hypothetical protein